MSERYDLYCERLGPEFWAEPWNAITNGAFIIAAIVGLVVAQRHGRLDWPIALLLAITFAVGVGSFLFHTFATGWALAADVIPIQLYIVTFFLLAMRRFAGLPLWLAGLATLAFVVASGVSGSALGAVAGDALNGSEGYIPPLAGLIVIGALIALRRRAAGLSLVAGGLLFAVSLTFRTIDSSICEVFPLGTHFLWHTLNGVLLGGLIVAMVLYGRRVAPAQPAT